MRGEISSTFLVTKYQYQKVDLCIKNGCETDNRTNSSVIQHLRK